MTAHLSPLTLHRYRYGELDGTAADRARAHLHDCTSCASRLREQEQERAAFVLRPVPEPLRTPRVERPWMAALRGWFVGFAAVAAVGMAVFLLPSRSAEPDTRTRGERPDIEAWVDLGEGPRPLHPGERLSAGDRVNLTYDPHGASAVAIAGRDSTGAIEVYELNAPTGVGIVRAPFALRLDDTPGEQELFVITSDAPLDEAQIRAAVEGVTDVHGLSVSVARVAIEKDL